MIITETGFFLGFCKRKTPPVQCKLPDKKGEINQLVSLVILLNKARCSFKLGSLMTDARTQDSRLAQKCRQILPLHRLARSFSLSLHFVIYLPPRLCCKTRQILHFSFSRLGLFGLLHADTRLVTRHNVFLCRCKA